MQQFSLKERLEAGGNLSVKECMALAGVRTTKFYADLKAGRVRVKKVGRKSVVPAAVALAYVAGQPLPPEAA